MKLLIAITVLLAAVNANSSYNASKEEWEEYKSKFAKHYDATEDERRMKIYLETKKTVEAHNELYKSGQSTFRMGLNKFADWTHEEFVSTMLSPRKGEVRHNRNAKFHVKSSVAADPDTVDWREQGYVTPVKDQGQCGSCWAFSVTGALEALHFKETGNLVSLSEQNLMDCSYTYGNLACGGGDQVPTFQYVIDNGGVDTEASYPYEERNNLCRFDPANIGGTASSYVRIPEGDEVTQKSAIATIGPISLSMDASQDSFHLYDGGIYYEPLCKNGYSDMDHAVLGVGYGTENGQDYWLVKNSWGISWGEEGYFRIVRNFDNNCGMATDSSYPL